MTCLAIHTSGEAVQLALGRETSEGFEPLAHIVGPMKKGQDAALPGLVDDILAQAGLTFREVKQIAVCVGPGSFTGLRIGLAYARGLALALHVPCYGLTSLEACLAPRTDGRVRVALQAQKRPPDITFWVQDFDGLTALRPPAELSLDEVRATHWRLECDRPDLVEGASLAGPDPYRMAARVGHLTPDQRPPVPAYVRAPDAALPGGKSP